MATVSVWRGTPPRHDRALPQSQSCPVLAHQELAAHPATTGITPTTMNAGKKHSPTGISTDVCNLAASRSIRSCDSRPKAFTAASMRGNGDDPCRHDGSSASSTEASATPAGPASAWRHADSHSLPASSESPTPDAALPNGPPTDAPTTRKAWGIEAPPRNATIISSKIIVGSGMSASSSAATSWSAPVDERNRLPAILEKASLPPPYAHATHATAAPHATHAAMLMSGSPFRLC